MLQLLASRSSKAMCLLVGQLLFVLFGFVGSSVPAFAYPVVPLLITKNPPTPPTGGMYMSTTSFPAPATITLTASFNPGTEYGYLLSMDSVKYYVNGALVGTATSAPWSYTISNVAVGTYSVYAVGTNSAALSYTTPAVTLTSYLVQPTIAMTAPGSSAWFNAPANVPLSVNTTGGTYPISSVSYYNGGSLLANVTSAPWSYTIPNVYAGNYPITAKVTTTGGTTATSSVSNVTVSTVPAAISLTSPANGSTYNAPTNVSLTASTTAGTFPISNVSFYNGSTLLTTLTNAPWSYTASGLYAGSYAYNARVTTSDGAVVSSGTSTVTVSTVAPTISLSGPANGASYNAPVSIPLSVSATGGTYPISSVSYYNSGNLLATVTSAPWSYTASNLYAGSYVLSAVVSTSGGTTASSNTSSFTVATVAPTISLTGPANGASYNAPASIPLSVSVAGGTYPISSVSYYNGGNLLATITSAPWSYTIPNLYATNLAITAKVSTTGGTTATTGVSNVTVSTVPATISLTSPANGSTYNAPTNVSLTASTTAGTFPISNVSFYNGSTLLTTLTSAPWSYTASGLYGGSYAYNARVTTSDGAVVSSGTSNVTVSTVAPTISLSGPANGTGYNAPVSIPLSVTATGGTYPISSVSYYNGSTLLATVTAAPWSYTASNLYAGNYAVSAKVNTSGGTTASSNTSSFTVSTVAPTISLPSPANGTVFNTPATIPMTVNVTGGTYPIASVSYYNNGTLLNTATSAPWSYTASGLAAGSYPITAQVTTTGGTTASTSASTVNVYTLPTISLTSPANGGTYTAPGSVPLSVTASGGSFPISSVSYYNGATLLGTANSAPWSFNATGLAAGTYSITAKVINTYGATATTGVSSVSVLAPPSVSMSNPTDGSTYPVSTAITLSVNANPGGYVIGSVNYYSDGTLLGTATSAPWSYPVPAGLAAGSYSMYAVLTTTTSGITATTTPIIVTVGTGTGAPISSATLIANPIAAPSLSNPVAGSLPGTMGVSGSGAATYSIPLGLPPGIASMAPSLVLNYSSQGGNGMLGMGWSLGGLSQLHRCNKTIAQDNTTSGVSFTTSDRLCLDGQRLVLVSAGAGATGNPDVDYWTVGATYSTEVANFSRITSYSGAHGLAFKVESKAGRVLFYGDQGDGTSYIAAQGRADGQAQLWALGQVQDLSGNYYTVSYSNNTTTGEYLPTQINYGGNNQTGLASSLSVVFNYSTTRTDNTIRYVAGSHNDMNNLLSSVQAYTGVYGSGSATKVREYDVTYELSPSSGRSMIQAVQMSALNPQSNTMVAFPATTFNWGTSGAPAFTEVGGAFSGPVAPPPLPVMTTDPTTHKWVMELNTAQFDQITWADFNGDGLLDAMAYDASSHKYYIFLAQSGGGFAAPILWTVPAAVASQIAQRQQQYGYGLAIGGEFQNGIKIGYQYQYTWGLVGDFDGDGSTDLFLFGSYVCTSQMKINPSAGFGNCTDTFSSTSATNFGMSWYPADYLVMDTTGAGKPDILMHSGTRCVSTTTNGVVGFNCGAYANTGYAIAGTCYLHSPVYGYVCTQGGVYVQNMIGDFNGDGRQDLRRWNATPDGQTLTNEVCLSGATGFSCSVWTLNGYSSPPVSNTSDNGFYGSDAYLKGASLLSDVNGDGLTDIIFSDNGGGATGNSPVLCYSTGTGFDCHSLTTSSGADAVIQHTSSIDSDGAVKTLSYEFNSTTGVAGRWRLCTIQNNSALNCQTIGGGPTLVWNTDLDNYVGASSTDPIPVDPIAMIGGFLNDGTMNLAAYDQSIDHAAISNNNSGGNSYPSNGGSSGQAWKLYTLSAGASVAADKLSSVTNGAGHVSSVTYTQGGQASVYTQYTSAGFPTYPIQSVPNPGYLVSVFNDDNGQGGSLQTTYTYTGQQTDATGRGSLGFASTTSTNHQNGFVTTTNFNQTWPYTGLVTTSQTVATADNNAVIANTTNQYSVMALPNGYYSTNSTAGGTGTSSCVICFPYVLTTSTSKADLTNTDIGTTITNGVTYDNFGNLWTSTDNTKFATDSVWFVSQTANTWDNNSGTCVDSHGASYVIGKLCSTTITKTNQAGASLTHTASNTYFASGLLKTEILEAGHTTLPSDNLQVTNTYARDSYGNVTSKIQSWLDPVSTTTLSRSTSMMYRPDARFPVSSTNAMGQTELYQFDNATGVKTQLTDINGLITTWQDDGLGRITSEALPGGNTTLMLYNQCQGDCPSYAKMVNIKTHSNNGQQSAVPELSYADSVGHLVRTMSYGFDGTPIVNDHTFDGQGRPLANYQPAYVGGATAGLLSGVLANQQTLDHLNRPTQTITWDTNGTPLMTSSSYVGSITTTVNPAGQTRIETVDPLRQMTSVQTLAFNNAQATTTTFAHDPFGNLTQTIDPAGNSIVVSYDTMGHKIQLNDPDLGVINYSVDPLGRTWKQVSPKQSVAGQSTMFTYDVLDRLIVRNEPDLLSYFSYDVTGATGASLTPIQLANCQTTKSCGKLVESWTASSGNSGKQTDTSYVFDGLGRLANSTTILDPVTSNVFYSETDYDPWSRPITLIYQRGSDPQKLFDQRYNAYGYLQSIQRSGLTLWQATTQDAANRVVTARLATFGRTSDGLIATRCYDANTGRLDDAIVTTVGAAMPCGSIPAAQTVFENYAYDVLGNVTQRSEAWNSNISGAVTSQSFSESFVYDGLNRITTSTVANQIPQTYSYSPDGNLLTKSSVGTYTYAGGSSGGPHAVKSLNTLSAAFTYDANGNQLTGNTRTNTWTSFDMPLSLSYGSASSQFTYGPNHERRTQSQSNGSIIYYGGAQEVQISAGQISSVKTYWPHGLGVEIDRPAQVGSELDWTHTDNLGSIVAITDVDGNLKEALGFDAWGSRRNAAGAPVSIATTLTAQVTEQTDDKGYTGQEMIDSLELVHLNGRVYDPLIGKFLSGDPFVSDPTNGQNYNRYSYVLNNPMNMTDPTGFSAISDQMYASEGWTTVVDNSYSGSAAQYKDIHSTDPDGSQGGSKSSSGGPVQTTQNDSKDQKKTPATNSGVSQAWGAVKDWAVDGWNHLKEGPSMNDLNGIPDLGPVLAGVGGLIKEAQVVGEAAQVQQVVIQGTKSVAPIAEGEVVSFSDFVRRSVVGDGLEAHELWQHANLKANGLATTRMGSAASKANPVIALSKDAHAEVSAAQRALDAAAQTPAQNIAANANILRNLNSAPESSISKIENWASDLAKSLGF